ncbi:hypothetical protein [Desulfuromonas acetoxidans]|uniref:hypothetical protein n=1 Tax=Desulfuromonas acetoxidans TaxID=891 RepID=UPI002931DC28|nr:hypothetical protein [Desulfuromonas acetoxidans]
MPWFKTPEQVSIDEQQAKIRSFEAAISSHIQSIVDDYNRSNGVIFSDVHSCKNYADVEGYSHQEFCSAVWLWNVAVWEASRQILADVLSGDRSEPTVDELIAELPVFEFQSAA